MENKSSNNRSIGIESNGEEHVVGLRPLAPALLSKEEMSAYEDEFDFVFKEDRIRNIALSGPYGAGKNTVMESWEALHPELSFIHVELAHFEEPDSKAVISRDAVSATGVVVACCSQRVRDEA